MPAPYTGHKRSYEPRDRDDDYGRRDRPRDWRDAYLSDRDSGGSRSRRQDSYSPRSRDHGTHGDRHRGYDRERERSGRGYNESRYDDREEGEIASPPKPHRDLERERPQSRDGDARSPRRRDRSPRRHEPWPLPRDSRGEPSQPARPAPHSTPAAAEEPEPVIEEEEDDPEKKAAERRRKREAILAKYKAGEGAKPTLADIASPGPGSGAESVVSNDLRTGANTETGTPLRKALGIRSVAGAATETATPVGDSPSLANTPTGNGIDLEKHGEASVRSEGVSAAEYHDVSESERKEREAAHDAAHPEAPKTDAPAPAAKPEEEEWEEVETEVEDEDDDVDMFAAFGEATPVKKKRKIKVRRRKVTAEDGTVKVIEQKESNTAALLDVVDNVDDVEGYYRITPGEILDNGRYQVTVTLGKGMFSAVIRAKVLKAVGQERRQDVVGREVAIKLMRSQESMYVAGRKEAQILKLLNDADPEDKKHIVRMERTFEHRGHFAIVTESLSMNLRDVIKRFGKDVGLNMRAVRAYAHQMLLSLSLMRKCNIVHADIKPDNVLVSENKAVLKVCDLGTAAEVSEGEITPYLVSRFYRAPEIILGLPYDTAIDMWAVGCTLFELYTGKILFPGRSNNHMLLLMMETKGKLPVRMIKKASLGAMHFDENNNFLSLEKDRITGADVVKTTLISKATRDLRSRLMPSSSVQAKMGIDELKQMQQFVDLLDKCLMLDPVRRISPREALLHPFVTGINP